MIDRRKFTKGTNHIKKKKSSVCSNENTTVSLPALLTPYLKDILCKLVPHPFHFKAGEIFPVSIH